MQTKDKNMKKAIINALSGGTAQYEVEYASTTAVRGIVDAELRLGEGQREEKGTNSRMMHQSGRHARKSIIPAMKGQAGYNTETGS